MFCATVGIAVVHVAENTAAPADTPRYIYPPGPDRFGNPYGCDAWVAAAAAEQAQDAIAATEDKQPPTENQDPPTPIWISLLILILILISTFYFLLSTF